MSDDFNVRVPDGVCGRFRVETFTVSQSDSEMTALRAAMGNMDEYVPAGTYKRLMRGGTVVMSNTPMERRTNDAIIRRAAGDVLINGLGLGVVLDAVLAKPTVRSVTVVEIAPEVIELVAPTFRDDPRVHIVQADALALTPTETYDAVWHDIWDEICHDNLPDMGRLIDAYRASKWQGAWSQKELLIGRRE